MNLDSKTLDNWSHHLRDEADAAFLYDVLARTEQRPARRDIFRRLAEVETRHVALWRAMFQRHGMEVEVPTPSLRARVLAWIAGRFGPSLLTSMLLREEGEEVKGYMKLHRESEPGDARDTALILARESAEHAKTLSDMTDSPGEPWHSAAASDYLRSVVYGFNDGLTANFGLVAGVIGANVPVQIVLVSGVAGTIADALSMGASGYLAAKSQHEVYQHEIAKERDEIQLMPEVEEQELALIYEAKGMPRQQAEKLAAEVLQDPRRALREKVREELGIGESHTTPLRDGWVTGLATAVGAFIPVLPFLFLGGQTAIWTSFIVAMLAHFGVGAMRTFFTGRGALRSGFDMFVVGLGVAVVGYWVGGFVSRWLAS